jgi:adenylate cyclase
MLKNRLFTVILAALAVSAALSCLMFLGFLDTWESKLSDALYSGGRPLDEIVIIAIDDASLQEMGRWPWPRDRFADVLGRLGQARVTGIDISFFEPAAGDSELARAIREAGNVVLAMEYTSFSYRDGRLYGEELLKPLPALGTPGEDFETGFVNLFTDSDGVTRSFIPEMTGVEDHRHFSLMVAGKFLGGVPDISEDRMLISLFAPPGGYERVSFSDVYHDRVDPSHFAGRIVLIGATAPSLHDEAMVPISSQAMPGVEVNANLVQSILTRDFLHYQDDLSAAGLVLLLALLAGLILYRFRIVAATLLLALLSASYVVLSVLAFDSGLIMNILYPLLSMAAVYVILVVIYYLTEERSRKWITSVFGKYVSPVVIDHLIENPESIKLGGEKRDITLLFSDIRGFTSISERLDPEKLVHLLNEYLSEMTSVIMRNQGLVDKYMGDAIMAFWGAPLEQPGHPGLACSTSLEMMERLRELQRSWKSRGIPPLDIGIGLNTGEAVVGNMGSFDRFDYTAMGDSVNLASRLEGLNKLYGTNVIISGSTWKRVSDRFEARKLDAVMVKGKRKPILIYELLARKGRLHRRQRDFVRHYEAGLESYFSRKWPRAMTSFRQALKLRPDKASEEFIRRCQAFRKTPPPRDWDGAWEMKTK